MDKNYINENQENQDIESFENCKKIVEECRKEASKRLIGQTHVIDGILTAFITGGHVLLEGVPGLAKTLAVKTFAEIAGMDFKRIQFTPDLLPADVSGTLIYEHESGKFSVRKGPVFTNLVLADEINRAPAKVQSALLEAMAEKQVTIGDETYPLPNPFLVLATENPIEQEGTYNLPEAELDRFLIKILIDYPSQQDEVKIVKTAGKADSIAVKKVLSAQKIKELQSLLDKVVCADKIIEYIVNIVSVTRNLNTGLKGSIAKYISFGASPRSGIALAQCAKVRAMFEGRSFVLPEDVKKCALDVLRHRLVLSYEAAADSVTADDIILQILDFVPTP
ncbi:AAA family ATPase [Treponema pectinovorum]|uniref:AAA family ATPase n=1 Tax=Treponema pectinovorum TaxID=164 RepID=UPI003D92006F